MTAISDVRDPLQGITIGMDTKHEVLTDEPCIGYTAIATAVEATVTCKDKDGAENVVMLPAGFIAVLGNDVKTISSDVAVYIS